MDIEMGEIILPKSILPIHLMQAYLFTIYISLNTHMEKTENIDNLWLSIPAFFLGK